MERKMNMPCICLIGFGEVGQILCAEFNAKGQSNLTVWDILLSDPQSIPSRGLKDNNLTASVDAKSAVAKADIIISAVTAAETINVAIDAVSRIKDGAWFLDLNSVSPGMKQSAARIINDAGGRYVEGALMAPIAPKRIATSMLLGGLCAEEFVAIATDIGFSGARHFSSCYGKASAAKMCRSVMVKGVESLLTESLLAARHYGVEDTVIKSLSNLFPGPEWRTLSHYMISRSLEHGKRRAEEMREAAQTVLEAGIEPHMSLACANRQDWSATQKFAASETSLEPMLDAIISTIELEEETLPC
jgi:3-hydroxyisobutyrate dehydrogenase-like beta-hydroxyacid dehydrogenase